jgi:Reverse transcriptase (RNA-dependent DNA polymerase)
LVTAGNMTPPGCDAYLLVVSFRTLRLAVLLGELNSLNLMVGDVTSAYLMVMTKELIFFKAGPEFMEKEGHLMIIRKSLYGLCTSGKSWHDLLFDTLSNMGFKPSYANQDIWMRDVGHCYEYVCSYADDLTVIMVDLQAFFDELKCCGFGLMGVTANPEVFLGGSFRRDPDGTLFWGAKRFIAQAMETYERMMGAKPKICTTPLQEKSHLELDTTTELDEQGQIKYQSLISACNGWSPFVGLMWPALR